MYQENPQPGAGKYLLAGPFLNDPNFRRSVVLLTEHGEEEGTVGFVLNKPLEVKLRDLISEISLSEFNAIVFLGGPVKQDSLHFIHRVPELIPGSGRISPGVYAGTDFEKLFSLILDDKVKPADVRFFMGYSGWGPHQLKEELKDQSWIVSPSKKKFTFSTNHESLWSEVLASMGKKFREISNYPEDPSYN